jgi:hypothetical protein
MRRTGRYGTIGAEHSLFMTSWDRHRCPRCIHRFIGDSSSMFTLQLIRQLACALLLCVAALPGLATEIDDIDIRANFTNFWSAMGKQDYRGATAFVHPLDLAALRTKLLPVFLKAGEIRNESVQASVDLFFDGIPKDRRAQLTGPEVYVLLFKLFEKSDPDTVEMFETVKPEIVAIQVEAPNSAKVRFKMKIDVEPESEEERAALQEIEREEDDQLFGKLNGRWYLRMDESPADTAAEFSKQLGL